MFSVLCQSVVVDSKLLRSPIVIIITAIWLWLSGFLVTFLILWVRQSPLEGVRDTRQSCTTDCRIVSECLG